MVMHWIALLAALVSVSALTADVVPLAESRPRHEFPRVGGYEVLSCDFHVHTIRSDGAVTPAERVSEACQEGYHAIAISDHATIAAYDEAKGAAAAAGLILIRALETGVVGQEHMVAMGVSSNYVPRNPHSWSEKPGDAAVFYQDELAAIAREGGVVIYAHPHVGLREPVLWGIREGIIRGVEVKNGVVGSGWNTQLSHGVHCYTNAFDWGLKHNLAILAGTDAHGARAKGSERTLVFAEERSVKGILDAVRAARTVAWFDGMLWGKADLLTPLVKATVCVRPPSGAGPDRSLAIRNLGPAPLQAVCRSGDTETAPVRIDAYEEVLVPWLQELAPDAIRWTNVWVGPEARLETDWNGMQGCGQ